MAPKTSVEPWTEMADLLAEQRGKDAPFVKALR